MKIGDRVIIKVHDEHLFGTIKEIGNIKFIGNMTSDLKVKISEFKTASVDFENVIELVENYQSVFSIYALSKIGASTFVGSGVSRDIIAKDLQEAMTMANEWLQEKHPGTETVWKDQANYRFKHRRAAGICVLDANQSIKEGWPNSWISVSVRPHSQTNRAEGV